MIKYLVVLLEHNAASFCCYEVDGCRENRLLPLEALEHVISHAVKNRIWVNFVYGAAELPPEYERLIEKIDHAKIMPLGRDCPGANAVFVIDTALNLPHLDAWQGGDGNNLILRVDRDTLPFLSVLAGRLIGKFKRLNIVLKDVGGYDGPSQDEYQRQLELVRELIEKEYRQGRHIEVNAVSDRVFLSNMNNCSAGVEHLTLAPNGKYYLCPAFYHENENAFIGDLKQQVAIDNRRLLTLEYAPVCRNCDAYHCKRCIYLNRKLTSEINTPSSQQCTLAHLERNVSRKFLEFVGEHMQVNGSLPQIPIIDYLDPFEMLMNRSAPAESISRHFAELLSKPLEDVPVRQLLWQIYKIKPAVLSQLKDMNWQAVDLQAKK